MPEDWLSRKITVFCASQLIQYALGVGTSRDFFAHSGNTFS